MDYLATVITSVFRAEEYIQSLLDDMERQTFFDMCEFILVDAASPENEFKSIEPWSEGKENVKFLRLSKDNGVYATWNYAIRHSTAPYITNWNCDDRRAPWALERQIKTLDSNPDVDLVYNVILETNVPNETFEHNSAQHMWPCLDFSRENMYKCNSPHNCPMWRRDIHNKCGYFNNKLDSAADYDMWVRAILGGSRFLKIDEPLALYYRSPRGVSTDPQKVERAVKEFEQVRERLKHASR